MNQTGRNPVFCRNCGGQLQSGSRFCHQCGEPIFVELNEEDKKEAPKKSIDNGILLEKLETKEPLEPGGGKLYHVYSIINNFRYQDTYYDNLKINWFVVGRETPQVSFENVIINYAELSPMERVNPETHIKEKFTWEEAQLLKQFLTSTQMIEAVIEEKLLPIGKDEKGYHDLPRIPGTDFVVLYRKQRYNLPFKVEGIFNVRMADERLVPDEQITVISKIPPEFLKK